MTITDLYPQIQALQHADKLRLMQFLITEFARDEQINLETTQITPTENIDALKTIANMAQPLRPEDLARNFRDYTGQNFK